LKLAQLRFEDGFQLALALLCFGDQNFEGLSGFKGKSRSPLACRVYVINAYINTNATQYIVIGQNNQAAVCFASFFLDTRMRETVHADT
jgi:hypothetical protein